MKRILTFLAALALASGIAVPAALADASICDIQLGDYLEGATLTCEGVIVTAVFFHGFYAQEPDTCPDAIAEGRQFSGTFFFTSGAAKPAVGDLVNVTGVYDEYFGETEIDLTLGGGSWTKVGTASLPPAAVVRITDVFGNTCFGYGGIEAENWEGVFIRVEQGKPLGDPQPPMTSSVTLPAGAAVGCPAYSGSPTRWACVDTNNDSLFVRNSVGSHEIPVPGAPITFIQGPTSYYREMRHVIPRDNNDIGYIAPPNVVWAYSTGSTNVDVDMSRDVTEASAENVANYFFTNATVDIVSAQRDDADHSLIHLATTAQPDGVYDELNVDNLQSEGGGAMPIAQAFAFFLGLTSIFDIQWVEDPGADDVSEYAGFVVTVEGRATSSNIDTGTSTIYVAEDDGPWNGIYVDFSGTQAKVGDRVQVSGQVQDGATEFGRTNIGWAGYGRSVNLGPGQPVAKTPLNAAQLPYDSIGGSEPYESVLVEIQDAVVDSATGASQFGEYFLFNTGETNRAKMDVVSSGIEESFWYVPCDGDSISIAGVVRYAFGQYHVIPRDGNDPHVHDFGPGCTVISAGEIELPLRLQLSNHPNPFNPTTTIDFEVESEGRVWVQVFDLEGRMIRELVAGEATEAGRHSVRWDGRDGGGQPVASGTYFYRVAQGRETRTARMTLLK
jgi:hypothetical protein